MYESLTDVYCYSLDEETFKGSFPTRAEAYHFAFIANADVDTVYTGVQKPYEPNYDYAAELVLKQLQDESYGEVEPDWDLSAYTLLEEAISQAIKQLVEKHVPPAFTVIDTQEHTREA